MPGPPGTSPWAETAMKDGTDKPARFSDENDYVNFELEEPPTRYRVCTVDKLVDKWINSC